MTGDPDGLEDGLRVMGASEGLEEGLRVMGAELGDFEGEVEGHTRTRTHSHPSLSSLSSCFGLGAAVVATVQFAVNGSSVGLKERVGAAVGAAV